VEDFFKNSQYYLPPKKHYFWGRGEVAKLAEVVQETPEKTLLV